MTKNFKKLKEMKMILLDIRHNRRLEDLPYLLVCVTSKKRRWRKERSQGLRLFSGLCHFVIAAAEYRIRQWPDQEVDHDKRTYSSSRTLGIVWLPGMVIPRGLSYLYRWQSIRGNDGKNDVDIHSLVFWEEKGDWRYLTWNRILKWRDLNLTFLQQHDHNVDVMLSQAIKCGLGIQRTV